jgi:hypothetical protein
MTEQCHELPPPIDGARFEPIWISMTGILPILVVVFALATLGVLIVGVIAMVRGGDFNRRNSNRLMRMRVILQGITLALLALLFFVH